MASRKPLSRDELRRIGKAAAARYVRDQHRAGVGSRVNTVKVKDGEVVWGDYHQPETPKH